MYTTRTYEPIPPPTGSDRRLRQLLLAIGVVVALALAVAVTWAVAGGDDSGPAPGGSAVPTAGQPPAASQPPTERPSSTAGSSAPSPTAAPIPTFGYQPLWPFSTVAAADAWQAKYESTGSQPWHLDPGLTATSFTVGHLGFGSVNAETSRRIVGREAWIGVGYQLPSGSTATAAVVHLARMGSGNDAPREVVGTRDSTLTLTRPAYGSTVSSPITAGGRITGVDESLRLAVLDSRGRTLGQVTGIPAGGDKSPWSAPVTFSAPTGSVLTAVVSTGGHIADVERFAITGIRTGAAG